jgi:hypothetical protein
MPPSNTPPPGDDWLNSAEYVLEKIVTQNPDLFSDPLQWIRRMIRAMWTVCRIEYPDGQPQGTGFLISPDLVLTNNHVVADNNFKKSPAQVRCRFGFQTRTAQSRGESKPYHLAPGKGWIVASSATHDGGLDYAILRLATKAGLDRLQESPTAPQRGWVRVSTKPPAKGQSLYALQHPNGDPLKLADGHVDTIASPWLDYRLNTDHGSSGSPVFDNTWELLALHSRKDVSNPVNRGVLLSAIRKSLPIPVQHELGFDPPLAEVSEDFLERNGLPVAQIKVKIEAKIVETLSNLEGNDLVLLARAVLDVVKRWTPGESLDGTCDLGAGRQLFFTVNPQAITGVGPLTLETRRDTVETIESRRADAILQRALQMNNAPPWNLVIQRLTAELLVAENNLRSNLRSFLTRLTGECGA